MFYLYLSKDHSNAYRDVFQIPPSGGLFYDDNGEEVTVNQGRTMICIIRDNTDDFEIDGIDYYPDDHHTIKEAEDTGSTEEEAEVAPAEEPEDEEW